MNSNSHQPAFPTGASMTDKGLTKREYVALEFVKVVLDTVVKATEKLAPSETVTKASKVAYEWADIFLAQGNTE